MPLTILLNTAYIIKPLSRKEGSLSDTHLQMIEMGSIHPLVNNVNFVNPTIIICHAQSYYVPKLQGTEGCGPRKITNSRGHPIYPLPNLQKAKLRHKVDVYPQGTMAQVFYPKTPR